MSRKSLVYLDDVVQRILKDVLIPTIGFRDTSKSFGSYTSLTDGLRNDVTDLQIPPKSKLFIHNSMMQPLNIEIPDTAYNGTDSAYEPVRVSIDLSNGSTTLSVDLSIPTDHRNNQPYCTSCNKAAYEVLKVVQVKELSSVELTPARVIQVYFPEINATTSSQFGRAVVTIYSENRNVKLTDKWDGVIGNEAHVSVVANNTIKLGSVPYFDPIPNPHELMRSSTIDTAESVSVGAYQYLSEVKKTDPSTLYFEREDEATNRSGMIIMKSADQIQQDKDILLNIFGNDWSELDIAFSDDIEDITGAFAGIQITKPPKRVIGKNIKVADKLFMNTKITHISNQKELLAGMPKLERINSIFENTLLTDDIKLDLISSNLRLLEMNKAFKNTKITNTYNFWDHDVTYIPERDPNTSSLLPNPEALHIRLEGNGCYENVTTLPASLTIPPTWKADNNIRDYQNMEEFMIKRNSLLSYYNYDLRNTVINILAENESLDYMFSYTPIICSPKEITAPNAVSINSMYAYCDKMEEVLASSIAKLTTVTSARNFTTSCTKLTTYPENMFEPHIHIADYSNAMSGLTSVTGHTPTVDRAEMWQLANKPGYPEHINGTACFQDSTFDNMADVPLEWGGSTK